jgi:hypothetical protein
MSGTENERRPCLDEEELPRECCGSTTVDAPDLDPGTGCRRYFLAIAARDLESVLDAMTPEYGRQLRDIRCLPDFDAFFSIWCESQGRILTVLSSSVRGDCASVAIDTDKAVTFAKLRRINGRWLIASEQVERTRKVSAFHGTKVNHDR